MTVPGLILLIFAASAPSFAWAEGPGEWTGPSVGTELGFLDADGTGAREGDGFSYGLRANYDLDMGGYVIGGALAWDRPDTDLGAGTRLDETVRLGARAGIDAGANWYYGTVGWARASVDDPGGTIGNSDGYYFGLGYEVYLNPNTTAGAEILHQQFDDFDLGGFELDATTLNLSVNFRF